MYVEREINYGLWYTTSEDHSHIGYIDSDFVGNIDDMKKHLDMLFI